MRVERRALPLRHPGFQAAAARSQLVEDILEDAATAPSGANIQPWRVCVVGGSAKDELADAMLAASRAGSVPAPAHFPDPLPKVLRGRLQDFGARYYASLGIDRNDAPA
ncbi:nitroreductase family protein [Variovorax ginsengisoli]|jgi:nitroreductase|uniref:Nitroreductase family protein n=1 Tax=Variovorax ginsengisoli TaxID=363844 RepID=A0ABT8S5M7_9BURK|nr:nitroreductase family protein [Variovorax ginsengisoli]MDN8614940.1 nitroreductase family protein [Variovorax ginsengisoli]MDO1534110.1 nitroreductase family protein [Variovorax ginsengisoli]